MSAVADAFTKAFGRPDPATPNGLHFTEFGFESAWQSLYKEMGAGWFRDGFLYMFGEGLDTLRPCLDAWSFLVPPCDDRMIFGRNAYGALLVLDGANDPSGDERAFVLDPFTVTFDRDPNMHLRNTISNWMPRGKLPAFTDDTAYRAWRTANGVDRLGLDDVLGIKVPKALGGTLTADNLQLDGIVDYYQTTAPIYAEAFAKLRAQKA